MLTKDGKREYCCVWCGDTAVEKTVPVSDEHAWPWWLPRQRYTCVGCGEQFAWPERGKGKVGDSCSTVTVDYNHCPDTLDIWIPYNGRRYDIIYDVLMFNGTVIHDTYHNSFTWATSNAMLLDKQVRGIRLPKHTRYFYGSSEYRSGVLTESTCDIETETMEFNYKPFNITRHVVEAKMDRHTLDELMCTVEWNLVTIYGYTHVRVGDISYFINEEGKLPDWSPDYLPTGYDNLLRPEIIDISIRENLFDCTEQYNTTDPERPFEPIMPNDVVWVGVNGMLYKVEDGRLSGWDEVVETMVRNGLFLSVNKKGNKDVI